MNHLLLPFFALGAANTPSVFGIRVEFLIFGLTLIGVAVFFRHTFRVAVAGLAALLLWKLGFTQFDFLNHMRLEWRMLANLFGLLMGFAILAKHFEHSRVPNVLPQILPQDWKGGFVLLTLVFLLATFIDNIASAMLGGAIATVVFRRKVHIGFIAAIAAAANAGGAFSVIGNTTTTMMWIDGVPALSVFHAFVGSIVGLLTFGVIAAKQQHRHQPISRDVNLRGGIDWGHMAIVVLIPLLAIVANITLEFMAAGVWTAILIGATFRRTDWGELHRSLKGSLFLLALVLSASMMPVEELPPASVKSTFIIGLVSAVFDNIPLTKLTLVQGGYDWGFAAYCVGCGGSMIWFGSSAGVALCNTFSEARSVFAWVRHGWHVSLAYALGFFAMWWILGWHPHAPHKRTGAFHEPQRNRPPVEKTIHAE
jgi:Na+/H+ antiporter NhaD/arsenite permease-like protein